MRLLSWFLLVSVGLAPGCHTSNDTGGTDAGGADAGSADAGSADAGAADAGSADAGSADAGSADAGSADAGAADAGAADAGAADAGSADAGNQGGPEAACVERQKSILERSGWDLNGGLGEIVDSLLQKRATAEELPICTEVQQ